MVQFTFESFYMAVLFSNLMILILYLLFRKEGMMIKLGASAISAAIGMILLRMLVPLEFLFLSHNVYFTGTPALIAGAVPVEHFFGGRLSVWSFLMIAWAGGAVIAFVRFWKEERCFAEMIAAESRDVPDGSSARLAFERLREEFPRLERIRIGTFAGCDSPFVYGIVKPCIFLPEKMEMGEKELYYVLRHEASHYLHHDMYLKLFIKGLCILYWWNPLCRFLWRKTDTLLEMRVDRSIAKDRKEKAEYVECLIAVAERIRDKNRATGSVQTVTFFGEEKSELLQRVDMLVNEKRTVPIKIARAVFVSGVAALFVLSYVYIFEPHYEHPKDVVGTTLPGPDNAYFIERKDGKYDFYLDGEFVSIEDSLEYFSNKIPIYEEEMEIE